MMRRPDIEEGDAAQPLLPEALDDEDLVEGRQPSWWEPQHVTMPDSPGLSAFANIRESAPGTPNGSRGLESGRQSPRTTASGATKKSGKGGTRESRARQATFVTISTGGTYLLQRLRLSHEDIYRPVSRYFTEALKGGCLCRRTQWLVINSHGIKTSFTSDSGA